MGYGTWFEAKQVPVMLQMDQLERFFKFDLFAQSSDCNS